VYPRDRHRAAPPVELHDAGSRRRVMDTDVVGAALVTDTG
jgi:hypothetical protein